MKKALAGLAWEAAKTVVIAAATSAGTDIGNRIMARLTPQPAPPPAETAKRRRKEK